MPQAIVFIGLQMFAAEMALAAFVLSNAVFIGNTLLMFGAYAYQERQKRKMRSAYNAAQVDRLANVNTTSGPRELVLGKVRKGGYILFRDSCGTYNDRFVMVVALAAHEIEGVESWYLNDQKVTLDANGHVNEEPYNITRTETVTLSGSVTPTDAIPGTVVVAEQLSMSSDYDTPTYTTYTTYQRYTTSNSKARIRLYTGTSTQTADARLMELFPTVWTSNHRLRGIAYAIVEFVYDETAFPSGLPNLTAVVKGAKVYDPRSDLTAWSENPALHMLHVLQHPYFGKRTSVTSSELARVSAAANACDELYTPSGGTAVALYRSAIVLPFGGQASDAFDDLGAAMCGSWAYAGGEFFVKAGKYTAPVIELTEDDLLTSQKDMSGSSTSKSITINTHRSRADKVNTINVKIYDADADYKETPVTPVKNDAAITKDGRELATDLTLPSVSTASQAKVIANYMLKDSFDSLSITASFKLKAYQVELFDNIYLTIPRYGWSSKVFTVNGKKFDSTGVVELSLRETSAELFNPLVASNSSGYASNTQLVASWDISAPSTVTVSSGTSDLLLQADGTVVTRVKVSWPSISDIRLRSGGVVEVQFQELGATSWNSVVVSALETYTYLLGCRDLSTIIVRVRVKTALAVSDWVAQVVHTVLGKTEPPSSVTAASVAVEDQNLVARWEPIPDVDVGGYEIRTADSGWGDAGFVFQGVGTSTLIKFYASTSVWYIKAYDRSGNYSVTAKSISFSNYTGVTSGVSMNLSNEVHVLPASSDGVIAPTSYVGSGTSIRIYEGATELEYDGVGTTNGTWKITLSAFNITAGALSDNGTYVTVADHSGVANNVDIAAITYTATGKNSAGTAFTIVKTQSFSKTKSGTNPIIYAISTSSPVITKDAPDVATDGAYSSITIQGKKYEGGATSNYGWVTVTANGATEATTATNTATTPITLAPATNADKSSYVIKLYNQATVSGATLLDSQTIPVVFKGAAGAAGATGLTATIDMSGLSGFKKNAGGAYTPTSMVVTAVTSNITSPTFAWAVTGATFTPTTGSSTTITPTAGSDVISVTLTVTSTSLASPMSIKRSVAVAYDGAAGEAGANGVMSAFPTIYIWTANSTPPARPTTTSNYTWGTGAFTPPTSWSTIPPSNTVPGNYLWSITVPLTVSATTTTSTLDWTNTANAIRGIAYNGSNGESGLNGTRTAVINLYQRATTPPTVFPAGNSTYTWSTSQFTAPATLNGWNLTPPAPVVGSSLYVVRQIYADSLTETTTTIPWTATSSEPFTVGTTGTRTAFLELYIWSATTPTIFPSGTSSYTWSTGAFTLPATPNGWSNSPGAAVAGLRLWGCQVSLTTTGTTTPTSVTWNTSTAYDVGFGVTGSDGADGAPGSATFLVTRSANDSTAPTNSEVQAVINRLPVAGDICTISYNAGNNSTAYKYITSWTLQTTYITGSLIVQNSISGDRIIANSLSANRITNGTTSQMSATAGTFSLGDQTFIIFPTTAAFTASGAEKWALTGYNSGTTGFSHGIGGGTASANGFGAIGYSAYNLAFSNFRTYGALGQGTSGVLGTSFKTASFYPNVGNNLNYVNTTFTGGHSQFSSIFMSYLAAGASTTSKFEAYIAPSNAELPSQQHCAVFQRSTDAGVSTEQVFLAAEGFAVLANSGKGKIYAYDGFTPFTGAHHGVHDSDELPEAGDIVVDIALLERGNVSATLLKQAVSTMPYQKTVIGVFTGVEELNQVVDDPIQVVVSPSTMEDDDEIIKEPPKTPVVETYQLQNEVFININALGEGQVNVCGEAGNIEAGDLIVTSSIPGKGMKQSDDIIRSCTVAKARESVTFDYPNQVKMVACTYLCG